jgi:hypothetical protein
MKSATAWGSESIPTVSAHALSLDGSARSSEISFSRSQWWLLPVPPKVPGAF